MKPSASTGTVTSFYDQLRVRVVGLTAGESLVFAASTVVLFFLIGFKAPHPDHLLWAKLVGNATLRTCYFPALVMVLRRPNEGAL